MFFVFDFQLLLGLCMLPFVYLLSFVFKNPLVAYAMTVFLLSVVSLVRSPLCNKINHSLSELCDCVKMFWQLNHIKDVRAHCYCASLVRTLYMTWRVPRHVFQARAPCRKSTKYRADDLCGNLICEYFCWMLGDTHIFFRQITSFSDSFHYTKKQNKSVRGKFFKIISHKLFKQGRIGTWMQVYATQKLPVLRLILLEIMTQVAKIYQIGLYMLC